VSEDLERIKAFADAIAGSGFSAVRDALVSLGEGESWSPELAELVTSRVELIHPDIVLDMRELNMTGVVYPPEVARGVRQWIRFWTAWFEPWDDFRWVSEWEDLEPGVVIQEAWIDMRGRASGAATSVHQWHRWEIFDGKVMRLSCHTSREAALAGPKPSSR
jgi:hypothetical protein